MPNSQKLTNSSIPFLRIRDLPDVKSSRTETPIESVPAITVSFTKSQTKPSPFASSAFDTEKTFTNNSSRTAQLPDKLRYADFARESGILSKASPLLSCFAWCHAITSKGTALQSPALSLLKSLPALVAQKSPNRFQQIRPEPCAPIREKIAFGKF